ncbi:hypothetical protein IFR05_013318 [Cadophora sp. M221]|nr:hypothetical protein IFR05_013318 [Cadophora sp. M221]
MESPNPKSRPRQRRKVQNVNFAQGNDESEGYSRRVYPPTPIRLPRLPRHEFEDRYPNWKKYLTALLILGCISLGLGADYALAKDDQAPAVCYLSSWAGLEKCPANRLVGWRFEGAHNGAEAKAKVLPLSGKEARKIDKSPSTKGVIEEGLKFADYIYNLSDLMEPLYKAYRNLDVNGHELAMVVENLFVLTTRQMIKFPGYTKWGKAQG